MAGDSITERLDGDYAYEDEQGEQRGVRLLREILEVAVITLLLFVVVRAVVQNYRVEGPSMVPTLQNHQYILVDKLTYFFGSPHRGAVIVFEYPKDTSEDFVKRIVGLPGDTVQVASNGQVSVNGVAINEPYVNDLGNPYGATTLTLGPNQYFVLGDNRGDSSDSRAWGPVPRNEIIGRAELVYWPLNNIHVLTDWSRVFGAIPHP